MEDTTRNSIKTLTRIYYDYQRERTRLDGRLGIRKDGEAKARAPVKDQIILAEVRARREDVLAMEEATAKSLAPEVHKHPLWKAFLADVLGVGEVRAAVQISEFDIHVATTVSKMWQFAGCNPGMVYGWKYQRGLWRRTDELIRGDKRTKGFRCPYNQFLKDDLLGRLGPSFLKAHSPYCEHYYNMRQRLESMDWGEAAKNPTDPKKPKANHQHRAANRYMVKMYLIDLYVAWRTVEGLPVREPYAAEYLGRGHHEEEPVLAEE